MRNFFVAISKTKKGLSRRLLGNLAAWAEIDKVASFSWLELMGKGMSIRQVRDGPFSPYELVDPDELEGVIVSLTNSKKSSLMFSGSLTLVLQDSGVGISSQEESLLSFLKEDNPFSPLSIQKVRRVFEKLSLTVQSGALYDSRKPELFIWVSTSPVYSRNLEDSFSIVPGRVPGKGSKLLTYNTLHYFRFDQNQLEEIPE